MALRWGLKPKFHYTDPTSRGVHPPKANDAYSPSIPTPSSPLTLLPFPPSPLLPYSPQPHSLSSAPLPLEVGPLNPAREFGEHCKLPQLVRVESGR